MNRRIHALIITCLMHSLCLAGPGDWFGGSSKPQKPDPKTHELTSRLESASTWLQNYDWKKLSEATQRNMAGGIEKARPYIDQTLHKLKNLDLKQKEDLALAGITLFSISALGKLIAFPLRKTAQGIGSFARLGMITGIGMILISASPRILLKIEQFLKQKK